MLFAYTTQAACAVGGPAKIKENVENGLKLLNEALANSNIGYQVRAIPEYVEVEYASVANKDAVGKLLGELRKTDGAFNKVHQFRKQKKADMVCLIFSGYGMGQADLNGDMMVSHYSTFDGSYVFPHEFGHNLGATHEAGSRFFFGQTQYRTVSNNGGVAIPYFSENRTISHTENGETKTISLGDANHDNAATMRKNAPDKAKLGEKLADVPSVANAAPAKLVSPAMASMPGCQKEVVDVQKCYIDNDGVLTIEYSAVDEVSFKGRMVAKDGIEIEGSGFGTNLKPGETKWASRYQIAPEPGDLYLVTINDKELKCPIGRNAGVSANVVTVDGSSETPSSPTKPDKPTKPTKKEPTVSTPSTPVTPTTTKPTNPAPAPTTTKSIEIATGKVTGLNRPGDPTFTAMHISGKDNIVATTVAGKTSFMVTQPDKAQAYMSYDAVNSQLNVAIQSLGYKDVVAIGKINQIKTGDTYTVSKESDKLVWRFMRGGQQVASFSVVHKLDSSIPTSSTPTGGDSPLSENIARGKKARQSSTAFGGDPNRAIDGNTDGQWGKNSVTHTNDERSAWWEVDLGDVYEIDRIVIWNRDDCCWERLQNFLVLTSEKPMEEKSGSVFGDGALKGPYSPWSQGKQSFEIGIGDDQPRKARYIRITLRQDMKDRPLSLAEVEVFGSKP